MGDLRLQGKRVATSCNLGVIAALAHGHGHGHRRGDQAEGGAKCGGRSAGPPAALLRVHGVPAASPRVVVVPLFCFVALLLSNLGLSFVSAVLAAVAEHHGASSPARPLGFHVVPRSSWALLVQPRQGNAVASVAAVFLPLRCADRLVPGSMILTSRGKEVQFWVHLANPTPPGPEAMAPPGPLLESSTASTSGRPPPQAHALLTAASAFKEILPEIYRSLSADGTRIYDSIESPPDESSSVESSSSCRIHSLNSQGSTSTSSSSDLRLSRQSSPDPHTASSSLQQRSSGSNPAPPPSPALKSRSSRHVVLSSGLKKTPDYSKCGGNVVPQRIIDTWDRVFFEEINTDVTVYTNVDGYELCAHSIVLMSSSPIFKCVLQEQFETSRHAALNIRGVPFQAVRCFLRFLYSSRCEQADMEQFALQLIVLAHAYMIPALKRVCTDNYEHGLLNSDNVVDILQIARLCDEPRLYLLCLRRIVFEFKTVARLDAWRVMKETDPNLEQELVEAVIEADTKKRDRSRKLEEDKVYAQLHDAMEALVHICRDGCRSIGPHDKVLDGSQGDCSYPACKGLESLVRHFAVCKLKVSGGCVHCKRMWQLLELHSRMCTLQDQSCKVPLCRHFKERVGQQPSRKEEMRWKMLVRNVKSAKAASGAFSLTAMSARLAQIV